jgi:hypothetical protein
MFLLVVLLAPDIYTVQVFEWGDESGPYMGFGRGSLDDPWVTIMARFAIEHFNKLEVGFNIDLFKQKD